MRTIAVFLAAAILIAGGAFLIRVQPAHTATVFRQGENLTIRATPLYVRSIGAAACRVAMIGDRLAFESDVPATSASNDEISMHIRFTYVAPRTLPQKWPAGD